MPSRSPDVAGACVFGRGTLNGDAGEGLNDARGVFESLREPISRPGRPFLRPRRLKVMWGLA